MEKPSRSTISFLIIFSLFLPLVVWAPSHTGINLSPSLPYRLFYLKREINDKDIVKGSIVMFEHDYPMAEALKTKNMFKRVVCSEGESLRVEDLKYYCGEFFLGNAKTHSLTGMTVKNFIFNGKIPQGSLFVMGDHKDSYDSRYFGFISKKEVTGIVYPIF
jgi:conjugal transfer pilin signal peptidase TrbI